MKNPLPRKRNADVMATGRIPDPSRRRKPAPAGEEAAAGDERPESPYSKLLGARLVKRARYSIPRAD